MFMTESRVPYLYGTLNNELVWIGYEDKQSFAEKVLKLFSGWIPLGWAVFIYLVFSARSERTVLPLFSSICDGFIS